MKMRIMRWATVAAAIAAGSLPAGESAAQTGFDGVITFMQQGSSGKPTTVVQTSKGRKLRLDGFGADSGAMIIDGDAKTMMMIQPKERQYVVMTEEDAKQMAAMMGPMSERMKQHEPPIPGSSPSRTRAARRRWPASAARSGMAPIPGRIRTRRRRATPAWPRAWASRSRS